MFYTIDSIEPICRQLHAVGSKLVLVTGFFDLLHTEHIAFLRKARAAGDVLIVAIECDARARKLKGEGRPIEPQLRRGEHIITLGLADYCVLLDHNFDNLAAYKSLLAAIHPNVYAVSSHTDHQESKQQLVKEYGGNLIVVHEFNPSVSTTQLIQQNNV